MTSTPFNVLQHRSTLPNRVLQITRQNHPRQPGVERLEREIWGMTLTPPQMREEAARSTFAGPLDKKSCRKRGQSRLFVNFRLGTCPVGPDSSRTV